MKKIFKISTLTATCCLFILASQSYGGDCSLDDIDNVSEDSSMEAPVELNSLSDKHQVREKESEYIKTRYSDARYESIGQGLLYLNKKGRVIHAVLYKNEKGNYLGVFYDINAAISTIQKTAPEKYTKILTDLKRGGMTSEILN